jgi:site-specific DNA-adenine methylase
VNSRIRAGDVNAFTHVDAYDLSSQHREAFALYDARQMTSIASEPAQSSPDPIGTAVDVVGQLASPRPFFGFYGGKWRDALKHYPPPSHEIVVEPFAGSAGYSLRHYNHRVMLCEVDPVIAGVWQYLIAVTEKEIRAIPDLSDGDSVDDLRVCQEAKWLVGFWLNRGASRPRRSPSKWMRERVRPGSFWGERVRETIASQLHLIRHWTVINGSYEDLPELGPATWFIDPPYEFAGQHYHFGSDLLDYGQLADWCRSRPGQVIVCENAGATWLPFAELGHVKTTRAGSRSQEVAWVKPGEPSANR